MLPLIAAIAISLNLKAPAPKPPTPVCNIATVSYRFVGQPGTEFRYAGTRYVVPASGSIELLASSRQTEYHAGGRTLPLDVWPRDEFGTRTVPVAATGGIQ